MTLLDDVSFEISPGERVALVGGPLAGKTLILQLAIGLAHPSSGSIDGTATRRGSDCGMVFDTVSLLEDLTLRGNLRYFGMLFGMWGRGLHRRIEEVADCFGIADLLKSKVNDLDLSQLRLADCARAIVHRPRLLLIDEYRLRSARHDSEEPLGRLLDSPLADGLAVLVARRQPPEVRLASRLLMIEGGRIADNGLARPHPDAPENGAGKDDDGFTQGDGMATPPVTPPRPGPLLQ